MFAFIRVDMVVVSLHGNRALTETGRNSLLRSMCPPTHPTFPFNLH